MVSRACGPTVQLAPTAWMSLSFSFSHTSLGRPPPNVVPSCEKVICATIGQPREGPDGVDGSEQFLKSLNVSRMKKIDAALFESAGLLAENRQHLVRAAAGGRGEDTERADGPGDEHLMLGGVARFAGHLHAAMVEFDDAIAQAQIAPACSGWR